MATANHLEAEPFGYANGEVGVVAEVDPDGTVIVEFASGPAEVKGKALADLLHGWAITVHRAQGSEFPAVVVVLPPEAGGMLSRPLVYTALTRAQRHLSVVHAAGPALARAVRTVGALPRRTRLTETAARPRRPRLIFVAALWLAEAADRLASSGVKRAVGVEWRVMTAASVGAAPIPTGNTRRCGSRRT